MAELEFEPVCGAAKATLLVTVRNCLVAARPPPLPPAFLFLFKFFLPLPTSHLPHPSLFTESFLYVKHYVKVSIHYVVTASDNLRMVIVIIPIFKMRKQRLRNKVIHIQCRTGILTDLLTPES